MDRVPDPLVPPVRDRSGNSREERNDGPDEIQIAKTISAEKREIVVEIESFESKIEIGQQQTAQLEQRGKRLESEQQTEIALA